MRRICKEGSAQGKPKCLWLLEVRIVSRPRDNITDGRAACTLIFSVVWSFSTANTIPRSAKEPDGCEGRISGNPDTAPSYRSALIAEPSDKVNT